jgi:hypothetical protein
MDKVLKLEYFADILLGIFLFQFLDFSWFWFGGLLLWPDIGILGYLINNKVGALLYNILHHRLLAIILTILGMVFFNNYLSLLGALIFVHVGADRLLGFGLKYSDSFYHTHLGQLKNKK